MADEHRFGHLVHEYYVARVRRILDARAERLARVRTRAQAIELREQVRRKLRRCFGRRPPRTPLAAEVTGAVKRKHYTIEKLIYHSRPGFPVTANLYVPTSGAGPFPAVLGSCGHSETGKAEPVYQAFCQNLARQGYVVLIYDPISQGERVQYPPRRGRAQPVGCCQEHNMMGNQMDLGGDFFGMWRAWDGIRSLDYLLDRPEVDTSRVGVTGNSGGGTLTTYLTMLDDRFTMAAPSCFVCGYLSNLENELPADSEQIPPGVLAAGLDHADFFIARLPRPTLLLGKTNDGFDPRGLRAIHEELRRLYALFGAEDDLGLFIGKGDHGYDADNREAMYRFFNAQAGVKARGDERGPMQSETPATLAASPRGQVHLTPCRRVFDFTRDQARELAEQRQPLRTGDLTAAVARCLNLPKRPEAPHFRVLRGRMARRREPLLQSRFAVEAEPGIMAILHYYDRNRVYFHFPEGKRARLYVPHLSSTDEVVASKDVEPADLFAVDVRGIGELRVRTHRDLPEFFQPYGSDYLYASHGLMLGESYCGRRVHDVLSTLDLLQAHGYQRVHLIGRGLGSVLATFAAFLHPVVDRVTLYNGLLSFHELTQVGAQSWPFSSMVTGILTKLDLPDLLSVLKATKKLKLVDPWTSQMRPWRPAALAAHLKVIGLR